MYLASYFDLYIKKEKILTDFCSFKCLVSGEVWVPKKMKVSNGKVRKYVNIIFGKKL